MSSQQKALGGGRLNRSSPSRLRVSDVPLSRTCRTLLPCRNALLRSALADMDWPMGNVWVGVGGCRSGSADDYKVRTTTRL